MIKPTGLSMGIVMAATAAGTYYVLEMLPPGLIPPPIGRVVAVAPAPVAAPAPAVVAAANPAPAPAVETVAETQPAAAPETPAEEPAPAPIQARAAPPAPESAPAKPAPQPEPAEAPQEATPAPAAVKAAPEADVIKPWWPDPSTMPAKQLKLEYAGQVHGQAAIALRFSAPLKLETVQQNVTVRTASGEAVAGEWKLGRNPALAVLSGLAPGRYTVILQPQVTDQQGFMLGATLTGPVYVKE